MYQRAARTEAAEVIMDGSHPSQAIPKSQDHRTPTNPVGTFGWLFMNGPCHWQYDGPGPGGAGIVPWYGTLNLSMVVPSSKLVLP